MDVFALFHPSAHDAKVDWQTRQQIPAPVPSPGPGPGRIDDNRIVIEIDEPPC
jgi:hypothetical protein